MSGIAAIHVAVIALYPWSNERYPAFILIPVMVVDIIIILFIVARLANLMRG